LYFYYRSQQSTAFRHPSAAVAASSQPAAAHTASLKDFENDEILAEHLTRNVQFFGVDKQKAIASSFVVVIGLGVSTGYVTALSAVAQLVDCLAILRAPASNIRLSAEC
jgi:hypothetical protein